MLGAPTLRLLTGLTLACAAAMAEPPAAPSPSTIAPDAGASYLRPDGSVYVVGSAGMERLLTEMNALFARTHPGIRFTLLLDPTAATAIAGLAARVSAFAPMDRAAWPQETRPFRQVHGYEATDIRIGRNGYPVAGRTTPPAICVNVGNPLAGLTVGQVARIFTRGGGAGDLTHWGQLGLTGEWAQRVIHLYGTRDNGGFNSALRRSLMGGLPFSRRYEPLADEQAVLQAVADDPRGIGLLGARESAGLPAAVRLLPLALQADEPYHGCDEKNLAAGLYPLAEYLHLYLDQTPGQPADPLLRDYVRLVLSPEGQAIVRATGGVPLSPAYVAAELARLPRGKPSLSDPTQK